MEQQHQHKENLVDHYWETINYQNNLIRASEVKAGLILSFYGIVLNIMLWTTDLTKIDILNDPILSLLLAIWIILISLSIFYSIKCFLPIIEKKYKPNIIFFENIISSFGDIDNFSAKFLEVSSNQKELFEQLGQQIYILAKIASVKFKFVLRSIKLFAFSLATLAIILLYISLLNA